MTLRNRSPEEQRTSCRNFYLPPTVPNGPAIEAMAGPEIF